MITESDVRKLLVTRAEGPSVLSVYLWVPVDPSQLREIPALADDLVAQAMETLSEQQLRQAGKALTRGRRAVWEALEQRGRDWMGHTVAIFADPGAGSPQIFALPTRLPDRAVAAVRPHVRPLLVALRRAAAYLVAVVDRRHAWIFRVVEDKIEPVATAEARGVRSPSYGGWHGWQEYRIHERISQLAHHHFRDTAVILADALADNEWPLIIGGHDETIPVFLGDLPSQVRDRFAGSFVVDPATMTPARVRELSAPLFGEWAASRESELVTGMIERPPDGRTAIGLSSCLAAVNQHAIGNLVLPVGGLMPGYQCRDCGALAVTPATCPHGPEAAHPVPDLLEEMATATLEDGGRVEATDDPPGEVLARLRFPLAPVPASAVPR